MKLFELVCLIKNDEDAVKFLQEKGVIQNTVNCDKAHEMKLILVRNIDGNVEKVNVKTVHTQNVERMWRPYKDDNRRRAGTHRHMIGSYMAEYMWRVSLEKDADIFEEILKAIKEYWPPGKKVRELTFYKKMNDTGDFDNERDVSSDEE